MTRRLRFQRHNTTLAFTANAFRVEIDTTATLSQTSGKHGGLVDLSGQSCTDGVVLVDHETGTRKIAFPIYFEKH